MFVYVTCRDDVDVRIKKKNKRSRFLGDITQNDSVFNRSRKSNEVVQSTRLKPPRALQEHARNSCGH